MKKIYINIVKMDSEKFYSLFLISKISYLNRNAIFYNIILLNVFEFEKCKLMKNNFLRYISVEEKAN